MKPKEKAFELVEQFMEHTVEWDKIKEVAFDSEYHAKKCALIAVDELINNQKKITKNINKHLSTVNIEIQDTSNYWNEVKQEIEKL